MNPDPLITHLMAMAFGFLTGVMIALPWRPLVRRRVRSKNIAELERELAAALAEMNKERPPYPPVALGIDPL